MFEGLRKSSRLIANPSLFNWPKKPAEYINLEEDNLGVNVIVRDQRESAVHSSVIRMFRRSSKERMQKYGDMDIRTEVGKGKQSERTYFSDEDEVFVTPNEILGKTCSTNGSSGRKVGMTVIGNMNLDTLTTVDVGNVEEVKLRKRTRQYVGTEDSGQRRSLRRTSSASYNEDFVNKSVAKVGKREVKRSGRKMKGRRNEEGTKKKKQAAKKQRDYSGYIQKKHSPSILTDVVSSLSAEQAKWVRDTGFGKVLHFRMNCFTHVLGYKIVESFSGEDCCLVLKAGKVKIEEETVKRVLGFPKGDEAFVMDKGKKVLSDWSDQYPVRHGSEVTPIMVRDKLIGSSVVDRNFKLNFIVLVYNFLIECHQNRFINRDVLKFKLDIDVCGKYNWCRLLIDKLKKAHSFWAADKSRFFAGPLAFLIYLYVSSVRNKESVYVDPQIPTYRGWSDMLLRERQAFEAGSNGFGYGEVVQLSGNMEVAENRNEAGGSALGNGDKIDVDGEDYIVNCGDAKMDDDAGFMEMVVEDSLPLAETEAFGGEAMKNVYGGRDEETNDISNKAGLEHVDVYNGIEVVEEHDGIVYNAISGAEYMNAALDAEFNAEKSGMGNMVEAQVNKEMESRATIGEDNSVLGTRGKDDNSSKGHEQVSNSVQGVELSTQALVDEEIDKHYAEEPYMKGFEKNLMELDVIYGKCMTNFIESLALYPNNGKLAELESNYGHFFQIFREASPLSKSLSKGIVADTPCVNANEDDGPSFALGISQMSPKNLEKSMERCVLKPDNNVSYPRVNMRPQRVIKLPEVCKSPFVTRVVNVSDHNLTVEERNTWEWLFLNKRNQQGSLFEWNGRACNKGHFQSLKWNELVQSTVIDTWTYLLNENEIFRARESPLRIFFTTETTFGPLKMKVAEGDKDAEINRYVAFDDNVELVLQMVNEMHNKLYDITDFDMFVFPVINNAHHYIITYNIKRPRWCVLDNRVQSMGFEETYGELPWVLHNCFCHLLEAYNLANHSEIENLKPNVLSMAWQTVSNNVDCGVFVMRHMETYMGNAYLWRSGLKTEKENQKVLLNKLRVIYAHRMLTWARNRRRTMVTNGVSKMVH